MKKIIILLAMTIVFAGANYTKEEMCHILIGEAVGEGEVGMMAVAFTIKNRLAKGMPLEYSSKYRPDFREFLEWNLPYYPIARRAYENVFVNNYIDFTGGATHYESIDFISPYWIEGMIKTARIGKHIFYKEE